MPFEYCRDPEGWGPFNRTRVDFTPCALHLYVMTLPWIVLFLFLAKRMRMLWYRRTFVHLRGSHFRSIVLPGAGWLTSFFILMYTIVPETRLASPSLIVALSLPLLGWFPIFVGSFGERFKIALPFNLLLVCYMYIFASYTLFYLNLISLASQPSSDLPGQGMPSPGEMANILHKIRVYLIFTFLAFVWELLPEHDDDDDDLKRAHPCIRTRANIFSSITYSYLNPLMRQGYTGQPRPLKAKDVPRMVPAEHLAGPTAARIRSAWEEAIQKADRQQREGKGKGRAGLDLRWTILFGTVGWFRALLPMFLYRFVGLCCGLAVPVLLKYLLRFLEQSATGTNPPPLREGLFLAFGMLVASGLSSAFLIYGLQLAVEHGQMVRGGLIEMIYSKSFLLAPVARQEHSVGSIVNRMSVDCEKWATCMGLVPWAALIPFQLAVAIFLLYSTIGWSIGAGILVVLILMPIQGALGASLNRSEASKLSKMDERVRLMSEILANIKVIKLYGWEPSFQKKVGGVREDELKATKSMMWARAGMDIVLSSTTLLMALSTFAVYAMVGGPGFTPGKMTVDVVFVSIALFGMVSEPMDMISHCMASMISLKVSSRRIQEFLLSDEIDRSMIQRFPAESMGEDGIAINIEHATLSWYKPRELSAGIDNGRLDAHTTGEATETSPLLANSRQSVYSDTSSTTMVERPALSNINIRFPARSLTAVVGRVGQGKSSLLSAILGDMYKLQGSITVYGKVAYVPQQPWILHGSIRHNIVLNKPFELERYKIILEACALPRDIVDLPYKDMTTIGERGVNLSGGQKQRVALARAVYQDADIFLLDDALSAVDVHVAHQLWTRLLGPQGLLRNKTRVLVTHGLDHLHLANQIVTLRDGEISEIGRYTQLVANRGDFFRLVNEYRAEVLAKRRASHSGALVDADPNANANPAPAQEETRVVPKPIRREKTLIHDVLGNEDAATTDEETVSEDVAGWWIYKRYAKAATHRNVILVIVLFMVAQAFHLGTNIWLKEWIDYEKGHHDDDNNGSSISFFLGIYGGLVAAYILVNGIASIVTPVLGGLRAARIVHDDLLRRVLRFPMVFFDTTPQGRVLNRFSSDLAPIDSQLAVNFVTVFTFTFTILGTVLVIAVSTPIFLLAIGPAAYLYLLVQRYYIRTSSKLKKIYHTTQSPLYSHFAETLAGVTSLRTQEGMWEYCVKRNELMADNMFQKNLAFSLTNRWLGVRLEWLGATMIFITSVLATLNAQRVNAALVGLALSYAVNISATINYLVRHVCDIQNTMTNLERIYEYSDKPTEAPATMAVEPPLSPQWPFEGRIHFIDYSTRYRQGLDLVLRNVTFDVLPGEKIGIVGRTGAGKSSLTLALFRIIEAANTHWAKACEPAVAAPVPAPAPTPAKGKAKAPAPAPAKGKAKTPAKAPAKASATTPATASTKASAIAPATASTKAPAKAPAKAKAKAKATGTAAGTAAGTAKAGAAAAAAPSGSGPSTSTADARVSGGAIWIDGRDISTIGLQDLRRHLSIIPQEPTLFAGTLRENLDPFDERLDADLWEALERAHLKDHISTLPGGLGYVVAPDGENFSMGQRSLICLARALLRKTKILVLDEATSSVDVETDKLIQQTIRTEFRDRTILTIAHRIKTVIDYDKILVLQDGRVAEFDTPANLLKRDDSLFYSFAKQAGEVKRR